MDKLIAVEDVRVGMHVIHDDGTAHRVTRLFHESDEVALYTVRANVDDPMSSRYVYNLGANVKVNLVAPLSIGEIKEMLHSLEDVVGLLEHNEWLEASGTLQKLIAGVY